MRQDMGHQRGLGMGRVVVIAVFGMGVSLGCSPRVGETAATADGGAVVSSGGTGGTSGAGGHGGHAGGAIAAGGHGGSRSGSGGGAGGAQATCTTLSCIPYVGQPIPTGYNLPSFKGNTDGLCVAADSVGCNTYECGASYEVACSPGYEACCYGWQYFEPEPCGWNQCFVDELNTQCVQPLAHKTAEEQSPICNWCASDGDCSPDKVGPGMVCNVRLADRMICGPK